MVVEMLTCAEVPEPAEDGISTIPFVDTIDASFSISRASEQEASVVATAQNMQNPAKCPWARFALPEDTAIDAVYAVCAMFQWPAREV